MLKFNVLTIFPEIIEAYFKQGILAKAIASKKIALKIVNLRDYAQNKHRKVDDQTYGGGSGMVLKPEPIFRAVEALKLKKSSPIILTTATGKLFKQSMAKKFSQAKEITIICGRYEGVDQRVADFLVTVQISIGDYVLSGGEAPALVLIDAIARMIPGVVGKWESVINDSFFEKDKVDHPHYTRPAEFRGLKVPEVLLQGHHQEIEKWRKKQVD